MTPTEFKKIGRALRLAYAELEKEALAEGLGLTSPTFLEAQAKVREAILKREGFTVEEFRIAKEEYLTSRQAEKDANKPVPDTKFSEVFEKLTTIKGEPGENAKPPTDEELLALIKPLIPAPHRPADGKSPSKEDLLALIRPLIPKVKDGETPSDKRLLALIASQMPDVQNMLAATTGYLEEKISFVEKKIPEPVDVEALKDEVRNDFGDHFKKNIDILGMPDFRKLAMGLQGQIDEKSQILIAGSNITLTPTGNKITVAASGGGTVGPGVATEIAYFDTTSTITGDTNFYRDITDATNRYGMFIGEVSGASTLNKNIWVGTPYSSFGTAIQTNYLYPKNIFATFDQVGGNDTALVGLNEDTTTLNFISGITAVVVSANATGTRANARALASIAEHSGAGTVTSLRGQISTLLNTGLGTIGTANPFNAAAIVNTGGGVITDIISYRAVNQTVASGNTYSFYTLQNSGANNYAFYGGGTAQSAFGGPLLPLTNDVAALGSATLQWSDLFLAEGGVINWDNGDATLTQVSNQVTLAGATLVADMDTTATAVTQSAGNNSTKIATTAYADEAAIATNYKEACKVATTGNLVGTYLLGVFTYTATGVDTIDGVALALNDRVLVKNQTNQPDNGIYKVTTAGAIGIAGILTRATDFDASGEINTGDTTFVTAGTVAANTLWAYTGIDAPTIGSTNITFAQVSADLIVGQSVILSGTTTRILYDNAGVLGEYTLTGSGTVVAMQTAPTFATSIATPSVLATSNDSGALGASGTGFSDLFLAEGAVINWDAGDATITQTGNDITVAGITTFGVGTSTAVTLGTIELGAASDTTLARVSAGFISVEGQNIATFATTTEASNTATVVAIGGIFHTHNITALAAANTFGAPTIAIGALTNDNELTIRILDNATARVLAWNAIFRAAPDLPLPLTTVLSKTMYVKFKYNTASTTWDLLAVRNNF